MNLDDLLFTVSVKPDEEVHIKIKDQAVCRDKCKEQDRPCTFVCPARVYLFSEEEQKIIVCYERCLEDGACYVACPYDNIDWRFPRGGSGVSYKFG